MNVGAAFIILTISTI